MRFDRESCEARRAESLAKTPSWYSPWGHLAGPSLVGLLLGWLGWQMIEGPLTWAQLSVVLAVVAGSNLIEWWAHKYLLHRRSPLPGAAELYKRHIEHHSIYTEELMELRDPRELRMILLPAWGVALILLGNLPAALGLWGMGFHNHAGVYIISSVLYVLGYEWCHLSYHLPREHFISKLWLVRVMGKHHTAHHNPRLMARWNFNVILPFGDWLCRTTHHGTREEDLGAGQ